jgi:hypothetical protein
MALTQVQGGMISSLPSGSVIQVVNATNYVQNSTSSSTPSSTTIAATITPKFATSKILVLMNVSNVYCPAAVNSSIDLFIYRGASSIIQFGSEIGYKGGTSAASLQTASTAYLDSPATTSATTYTLYIARNDSSGTVYVNSANSALSTSSVVLMEIAQ